MFWTKRKSDDGNYHLVAFATIDNNKVEIKIVYDGVYYYLYLEGVKREEYFVSRALAQQYVEENF